MCSKNPTLLLPLPLPLHSLLLHLGLRLRLLPGENSERSETSAQSTAPKLVFTTSTSRTSTSKARSHKVRGERKTWHLSGVIKLCPTDRGGKQKLNNCVQPQTVSNCVQQNRSERFSADGLLRVASELSAAFDLNARQRSNARHIDLRGVCALEGTNLKHVTASAWSNRRHGLTLQKGILSKLNSQDFCVTFCHVFFFFLGI